MFAPNRTALCGRSERGFLEVKKFAVYLVVPVLTVIAYNHPVTHPYFGRHVRPQRGDDQQPRRTPRAQDQGSRLGRSAVADWTKLACVSCTLTRCRPPLCAAPRRPQTPLYPTADPDDDSLEKAMELGFKQRAERLERERLADEKRKQKLDEIRQQRQ